MRRIRSARVLLAGALVAGCGAEGPDMTGDGMTPPGVRDSAGVRIVENGEAPAGTWRVGSSPLFRLGSEPDGPAFTWVQSGRILPDGGALVGDFGSGTLYRLGPDGSIVGSWGRKGEGPGEYQGLDAIFLSGDSIVVSDSRLRRVTLLSEGGEVLATHRLPGSFLHRASSILPDGRLLLVPGEGYRGVAEIRAEWVFETQPILAADPGGGSADTLAELPHLRRWFGTRGAGPGPVAVRGRAGGFAGGFAWARADEREVRWYDSTGRLVQVGRWKEEPVSLTAERRDRMTRALGDAYASRGADEAFVTAQLAELEEGLDRHEGPLPYWDSFFVDRGGNVWLREYGLPTEPSERWRVLTREGTFVGWVEVPEAVAVLDVTDDRILAVRLDELDVPTVVMMELLKP